MRKPFVAAFLLLALGILAGIYWPVAFWSIFLVCSFCLLLSFVFLERPKLSSFFLAIFVVFLGALLISGSKALPSAHISHSLKFCREAPVVLEGTIISEVQQKDFFRSQKYMFTLQAQRLKTPRGWFFKTGKVLVTAFGLRDLHYGDLVRLEGKLYPPFDFSKGERFSYKDYLRQKGILAMMSVKGAAPIKVLAGNRGNSFMRWTFALRQKLAAIFYKNLSKNEAALMEGMLLGERSAIPRQLTDVFVRTGTAHILAISGMNVAIVAFLIFLLLKIFPLSRPLRLVLTMGILIFHAILTGAQPPVVRATVMACVLFFGMLFEREADTMNSLALAGVVLLIFNPQNLFNVGFQLSFVCVFTILYFYPIMKGLVDNVMPMAQLSRVAEMALELVLFSLAAWIGTIGMIAYYFHMITPVTVLANLIIVPLLSPIVIFGAGLLLCGMFWPALAGLFAVSIKVVLNVMVAVIIVMSKMPYASIKIESFSLLATYLYYSFVLILFFMLNRFAKPGTSR